MLMTQLVWRSGVPSIPEFCQGCHSVPPFRPLPSLFPRFLPRAHFPTFPFQGYEVVGWGALPQKNFEI